MKINYIVGDLFELLPYKSESTKFIPHVCNNQKVWGNGFVLPLIKKWPITKDLHYAEPALHLGDVQFIKTPRIIYRGGDNLHGNIYVCNMIAQNETIRTIAKPIRYAALIRCMEKIRDTVLRGSVDGEIHAPMFGAGLAGGRWETIVELIGELWIDYGIPVNIYKLEK